MNIKKVTHKVDPFRYPQAFSFANLCFRVTSLGPHALIHEAPAEDVEGLLAVVHPGRAQLRRGNDRQSAATERAKLVGDAFRRHEG